MAMSNDIAERVKKIVVEHLGVDEIGRASCRERV
jgi:acyl carrier protein